MENDQNNRSEALHHAVRLAERSGDFSGKSVVAEAEIYLAFLKGEKA